MSSLSAISEELGEIDGQISDIFRALSYDLLPFFFSLFYFNFLMLRSSYFWVFLVDKMASFDIIFRISL